MPDADEMIARLYTAMDLWATGVALQRQSIRRRNPEVSDAQVEALLGRWLQDRPGAEMATVLGDSIRDGSPGRHAPAHGPSADGRRA